MAGTHVLEPEPWPARSSPRRRGRHLEDGEPPARAQHPGRLGQRRGEVGEVAQRVAADDAVERPVASGSAAASAWTAGAGRCGWRPACPTTRSAPTTRPPARAARSPRSPVPQARSSDEGARRQAQGADGGPPPAPVEPEGHDPVDQVVAGGDGVEHRPDLRGLLVAGRQRRRRVGVARTVGWHTDVLRLAVEAVDHLGHAGGLGASLTSKTGSSVTWTPPSTVFDRRPGWPPGAARSRPAPARGSGPCWPRS